MLVKRKLNIKGLGEKCIALKNLESGLSYLTKKLLKNIVHLKTPVQRRLKANKLYLVHWKNLRVKGKS